MLLQSLASRHYIRTSTQKLVVSGKNIYFARELLSVFQLLTERDVRNVAL